MPCFTCSNDLIERLEIAISHRKVACDRLRLSRIDAALPHLDVLGRRGGSPLDPKQARDLKALLQALDRENFEWFKAEVRLLKKCVEGEGGEG